MTIKLKMAQDELILSGVQVPTITPAPVSTSLVQETSPTTALPEREVQEQIHKERGIDRGEIKSLVREYLLFHQIKTMEAGNLLITDFLLLYLYYLLHSPCVA
ncbi:hypothetical protein OH784_25040 [Ectobacillus funiculus]|uniref:hypothetical protein n=1 Tax=Ectobacillus funiculus TaxID=137993 RepID=UPI00397D892F